MPGEPARFAALRRHHVYIGVIAIVGAECEPLPVRGETQRRFFAWRLSQTPRAAACQRTQPDVVVVNECQVLAVHGRTRQHSGVADIRRVTQRRRRKTEQGKHRVTFHAISDVRSWRDSILRADDFYLFQQSARRVVLVGYSIGTLPEFPRYRRVGGESLGAAVPPHPAWRGSHRARAANREGTARGMICTLK